MISKFDAKPSYSLPLARNHVMRGDFYLAKRARSFITNHYGIGQVAATVQSVFLATRSEHFYKTVELVYLPGTFADVYKGIRYDGIDWYLKFYLAPDDSPTVVIWSINWEGSVH